MTTKTTPRTTRPGPQGLYDPRFEHDACGVGFIVDIQGRRSHRILEQAIQVLKNLDHRGACGSEVNTGDGAGVLIQMPHAFNEEVCRPSLASTWSRWSTSETMPPNRYPPTEEFEFVHTKHSQCHAPLRDCYRFACRSHKSRPSSNPERHHRGTSQ